MTDEPNFSSWIKWTNLSKDTVSILPGIYVISWANGLNIENKGFSWEDPIIYIGMTNSKGGLKSRLSQFNNTLKGTIQHGGADRAWGEHHQKGYDQFIKTLHVSVWKFKCNTENPSWEDYLVMGDVSKAEYTCFSVFKKRFNRLPQFNLRTSKKYSHLMKEKS